MPETFSQYLKRWLSHSTERGLNSPLVKMPVKRFRKLEGHEFEQLADGGSVLIGTTSDPISRNLLKNFKTRINERGEHCAFLCFGAVEIKIAAAVGQEDKVARFPVCLKKVALGGVGQSIRATVDEDEKWIFNPVLKTHLQNHGIKVPESLAEDPSGATNWVSSQLTNRAEKIERVGYVGLFSSQQMVIQERFEDPRLCHVLAKNPVIQAKLSGQTVAVPPIAETTDNGLEDLGMVLPCDDSQLRVVQLSDRQFNLQVEGPPGTGKSQTIANIISNALWRGRNVLLVCDKKAAISQVEERLSDAGLKPALLNLHDEDLDKKQFLRQAIDSFAATGGQVQYPFAQLSQTREILNERVRFGRKICHAAMQVTNAEALGGLIQLAARQAPQERPASAPSVRSAPQYTGDSSGSYSQSGGVIASAVNESSTHASGVNVATDKVGRPTSPVASTQPHSHRTGEQSTLPIGDAARPTPPVDRPELDRPQLFGGINTTKRAVIDALYRNLPAKDKVTKVNLLAAVAAAIGTTPLEASDTFNRILYEEKGTKRLDLTPHTWEYVWRI